MIDERVSGKELEAIRARLSERDLSILGAVEEHQFLTTGQIKRLFFHAHQSDASGIRATVRVLNRLYELRVLGRLDRAVGGFRSGSSAFVWCLDVVGYRLTRTEQGSRKRFFQPSLTFLGHKLAVAETRITFEETIRAHNLELLAMDIETRSWRPFLGTGGQTIQLKPDLGVVTASAAHEDHWLIEVDQGTESFRTLLDKCAVYETYRRTGREQSVHDVFPQVLWIMPTASRAEQLHHEIERTRTLDSRLFRVITPDQLAGVISGAIA